MTRPDFLILGNSGQVGSELQKHLQALGSVMGMDYPEIDLSDQGKLSQLVRDLRPRAVLNAAAYTAVDKAESEPDLAMLVNGVAPGVLAEEAKRIGAVLVHYSTDYVFDGRKRSPYLETDEPNPLNCYGMTKLAGDRAIAQVGGRYFIFRTSWVYGARGRNFLVTILRLASEKPELRVVGDQIGAPTWCRQIAATTTQILEQSGFSVRAQQSEPEWGLYNLSSTGWTSWAGFTEAILNMASPSVLPGIQKSKVHHIGSDEYPTAAPRPKYSVLSTEKIRRTFGVRIPDWLESLREVMGELEKQVKPGA